MHTKSSSFHIISDFLLAALQLHKLVASLPKGHVKQQQQNPVKKHADKKNMPEIYNEV